MNVNDRIALVIGRLVMRVEQEGAEREALVAELKKLQEAAQAESDKAE